MANKPRWVFSRKQLLVAIRHKGYLAADRIIDVQMVSLRRKPGKYGRYIEAIRRVGYRINIS